MPHDDIEIRITKGGQIFVRVENASEQRLTDYRRFIEEIIGPIHGELIIERPDWEHPAELTEEEEAGRRKQEQQLQR